MTRLDGHRTLNLANGQKEIHTAQFKVTQSSFLRELNKLITCADSCPCCYAICTLVDDFIVTNYCIYKISINSFRNLHLFAQTLFVKLTHCADSNVLKELLRFFFKISCQQRGQDRYYLCFL